MVITITSIISEDSDLNMYTQKVSYLWNVKGITEHDFKPGDHVNSSRFCIDDNVLKSDWKLRLYPNGHDSNSKDKLILALIKTNSHGKGQNVDWSFSILDCDKEKHHELCFTNLNTNSIADLNTKNAKIGSLDNSNLRKWIHGDTLSVLCEVIASKKLNGKQPVERQELRMWSTTSIKKQCSSITSASVTSTEQTAILLYGQSFVQIKYTKIDNSDVTVELVKHPEIDYIWCQIQINYSYNSYMNSYDSCPKNSKYEWNGKLEGVLTVTLPLENNSRALTIKDFTLSTTFSAITPKESFVCDFITAKQEMQQNYKDLLTQSTFGDVSIHVGEKTLHAHEDILAARSVVFAAMFASNMLEASTKTVIVNDFQYETIHALLKHIYYGITEISGVDIAELFKAAVKYNLGVLQRDCEQLLSERIDLDNVMSLMLLENMYNAPLLKNSLLSFMKNVPHMQIN